MKEYVDMEVAFTTEGAIIPKKIRLKDGRTWKIDRLVHTCEENPGGGKYEGIRYTVIIGGVEKYIYERHGRWYVNSAGKEEQPK